jgi:hypothetical protein
MYCDVHNVRFELDEDGWPDCLTRGQKDAILDTNDAG